MDLSKKGNLINIPLKLLGPFPWAFSSSLNWINLFEEEKVRTFAEYKEIIQLLNEESRGNREDQAQARKGKNSLIRELCKLYRISNDDAFFSLICEIFNSKISVVVVSKIKFRQDRNEVLSEISSVPTLVE